MEFIPGYREANAPQRPVEEPTVPSPPVIKVNGHRTVTIADLEHAEAVREAHHGNVAAQPPAMPLEDAAEGRERQFAHFQSDAPACDNCGALDRAVRHLLPLLQLRQQHGMLVIRRTLARQ